jgi:ribose-phosphate pyrophosphokinase
MIRTINLTNPKQLKENSVPYKLSHFPDGQQDVSLDEEALLTISSEDEVVIMSRFNSFEDLELIICTKRALDRAKIKNISLFIPYLLGARSDIQFKRGGNCYLVDVIAPIINSLNFESVIVHDPHSTVAHACINNLHAHSNSHLVHFALKDLYGEDYHKSDNFVIVSPDGGALKKIYKVCEDISYKGEVYTCSKSRDTEGNLSKVMVPELPEDKDIIIIDDICDGGRTFVNIVKEARERQKALYSVKTILVVTHGIFSAGIGVLAPYFSTIYCTNSVKDVVHGDFIKQVNVF